jgi:RimJ/RimL family protein N-acetyltransferase
MESSFSPPVATSRLVLREITEDDLSDHVRLFSNPDVVRYLYDPIMSAGELRAHLSRRLWRGIPDEGAWCNLAVEHQGVYVGEVGLGTLSTQHRCFEVGYVVLPEFQGLGFATEATRAMIDVAFRDLGAHRVIARLDARNDPSRHVLERLGLRREAHLVANEFVKGEWCDELIFAVLDDEWVVTTA